MPTVAKPLKIALVLDDSLDKPDGVQQYVLALGKWYVQQGHDVHYLVGQTSRTDIPQVHSLSRNQGVRFNGNRMSIPLPASRRRLKALLTREQFDVLHVQMPYSPWLAQRIIRAAGPQTAVFGTFHIVANSRLVLLATKLLSWWLRPSLKRFDEVVSVSAAAARYAQQTFGLKSTVVPNVFDYALFHKAAPFPAYSDKTVTILFVGRLVPRKGCQHLLRAVARLEADELPPYRVLIGGKGPLLPQLQRYVQSAGLQDKVMFLGFLDEREKPRYYASADIAVFPSTGGESFGIVLLEAMASGRAAVLAGDNGGYRSVMEPQSDLLFKAADSVALADKLRYFMREPAARRRAAHWGESYSRQFDTAVVGQILLNRYRRALRFRRRP